MGKFSILEIINYFHQVILSKKKFPPTKCYLYHNCHRLEGVSDFVVRTTQNYHFFDVAPKNNLTL